MNTSRTCHFRILENNNTKQIIMKHKLIKLLVWLLSLVENDLEKAIREKGVPRVIYCHPSVFADMERKKGNIGIIGTGIRLIETEAIDKGKFILSWNEPFDTHNSLRKSMVDFGGWPITNENAMVNLGFNHP